MKFYVSENQGSRANIDLSGNKMESITFSLDDYDCIGFDLDCTLAEYNVKELMKLTYDLLANFLIQKKSYESEFLLRSYKEDEYFLQKGLIMDLKKGNVLKMNKTGEIVKATHGTVCLSDEEILKQYGPKKICNAFEEFIKDPLSVINSSSEKILRAVLDCFDMASILLFARIVDHMDEKSNGVLKEYNIWPDILSGLYYLYSRNHFANGESVFFFTLKKNPSLYYKKWTPEKLSWLKEVKSKKFVFLLTNSFVDFATLTANYCIGENWKDYFDIILCHAKKPFFFTSKNPFLSVLDNAGGSESVQAKDLEANTVYNQGNWEELKILISKHTNTKEPKCLYIGDNLIQDVYSPVHSNSCHSVAVSLELNQEFESSLQWGSYFVENNKVISYWNYLIQKYAMICISSLDIFVRRPFNFRYNCLKQAKIGELNDLNGYYKN